jgi:hypothetical protein
MWQCCGFESTEDQALQHCANFANFAENNTRGWNPPDHQNIRITALQDMLKLQKDVSRQAILAKFTRIGDTRLQNSP